MTAELSRSDTMASRPKPKDLGEWFQCYHGVEKPTMRLIIFPHAGGGPSFYLPYSQKRPEDIEVAIVCLPGRERRFKEDAISDMWTVVERVSAAVENLMDGIPTAFFGHSYGACVAFLTAHTLVKKGKGSSICHLFLTGASAPRNFVQRSNRGAVSKDELIDMVCGMGGTPREVMEGELFAMIEKAIRADFTALDTLQITDEIRQMTVPIPISSMAGTDDRAVGEENVRSWSHHTTATSKHRNVEGGHFFVKESYSRVLANILEDIQDVLVPEISI